MRHRAENTETGWILAKAAVLVTLLGTLSGFTVLSHFVSHSSAERIACLDNQRATSQGLVMYQADHDGNNPRSLDALRTDPQDPAVIPGRCPASDTTRYTIDAASGGVFCPNPAHRPGP